MSNLKKYLATLAAVTTVLTACSAAEEAPSNAQSGQPSAAADTASSEATQTPAAQQSLVIIDVRTPEEFAEGHLEGAINMDVNAPDFEDKLHELDPAGHYAVYCRSGNRSGRATQMMKDHNFTNVENVGSVQEASDALQVPIVK